MAEGRDQKVEEEMAGASLKRISNAKTFGEERALP